MESDIKVPTREEQKTAMETYDVLTEVLKQLEGDIANVTIKETDQKIKVPAFAIKLLQEIMRNLADGNMVNIVPIAAEVSTQMAADILGVSRPFVVKLLENNEMPYKKVGRHRRIKFQDVMKHKKKMIDQRRKAIDDMIAIDQKYGLYND